jgi:mono/diheme cytochrome c family protein
MPLLDDVWKFGSDDETLFKLVKGQIDAQTMPKIYGHLSDDDVWKIIAYIRSIYQGDPSKINW